MKEGKNGQASETKVLPPTRKAELRIILREHFFDLVGLSLMAGVTSLPLFLWLVGASMYGLSDGSFYGTLLTYSIAIPLFCVMGLGFAGVDNSIKTLVFNEGFSMPATFFEGIKKNFLRYLHSFLLIGIMTLLLRIAMAYLASVEDLGIWASVIAGILYGVYFLFLWCLLLSNAASITYKGSLARLFWNAVCFLFGKPFHSLGVLCLAFLDLFVFEFVPYYQAQGVAFAVAALFYFAFMELLIGLLSAYLYDLRINRDYPSVYRKGLSDYEDSEK